MHLDRLIYRFEVTFSIIVNFKLRIFIHILLIYCIVLHCKITIFGKAIYK